MAIATPDDVAAVLGRTLTTPETAAVTRKLQSAVGVLEGLLHRTLELDSYIETRTPIPQGHMTSSQYTGWSTIGPAYGTVALARRPVASITSVTLADPTGQSATAGADITASVTRDHDTLYLPTLSPVEITYLAGDDPVAPQVRDAIINAVARSYFVPAAAAAGVTMNYSVEGTSVTYGAGAAGDPHYGPFTGDEIRGLKASLGRIVIR